LAHPAQQLTELPQPNECLALTHALQPLQILQVRGSARLQALLERAQVARRPRLAIDLLDGAVLRDNVHEPAHHRIRSVGQQLIDGVDVLFPQHKTLE
jgi:hypothetical protein